MKGTGLLNGAVKIGLWFATLGAKKEYVKERLNETLYLHYLNVLTLTQQQRREKGENGALPQ